MIDEDERKWMPAWLKSVCFIGVSGGVIALVIGLFVAVIMPLLGIMVDALFGVLVALTKWVLIPLMALLAVYVAFVKTRKDKRARAVRF